MCGFSLLCHKNHQPGFVKDSSSFCWDHFLPLLFFFPCYKHYFIFEYHLWIDNILLPLNFFLSFLSFFLAGFLLFLGKILICTMNWISFCWWFCLGHLFERKFILGSKRVQWKIYWLFGMKKHGHISFWVLIAWFSERLTPVTNFNDSQHLSFFFFFLFILLSFAQISLLWAYQSDGLLLLFYFWMPLKRRDWEWNYSYENCTWLPQCDVYLTLIIDIGDYWDESSLFPAEWMKAQRGFLRHMHANMFRLIKIN